MRLVFHIVRCWRPVAEPGCYAVMDEYALREVQ